MNGLPLHCCLIAYIQCIKILACIRGFQVIFLNFLGFSLCSDLLWELQDNGVVKKFAILTLKPGSRVRILTYRTGAILLITHMITDQIGLIPSDR